MKPWPRRPWERTQPLQQSDKTTAPPAGSRFRGQCNGLTGYICEEIKRSPTLDSSLYRSSAEGRTARERIFAISNVEAPLRAPPRCNEACIGSGARRRGR
jgi:hypothetical protein